MKQAVWKVRILRAGTWEDATSGPPEHCRAVIERFRADQMVSGLVLMDEHGLVLQRQERHVVNKRRLSTRRPDAPEPLPKYLAWQPVFRRKPIKQPTIDAIDTSRTEGRSWPPHPSGLPLVRFAYDPRPVREVRLRKQKKRQNTDPVTDRQLTYMGGLFRRAFGKEPSSKEWRVWRRLTKQEAHERIDGFLAIEKTINAQVKGRLDDQRA